MKISEIYRRDEISGEDLVGKSAEQRTFTIKSVVTDAIKSSEGAKPCVKLWFNGCTRACKVNASSAALLGKEPQKGGFGDDTDKWVGRTVTLEPMETNLSAKYTGEKKMMILIRPHVKAATTK